MQHYSPYPWYGSNPVSIDGWMDRESAVYVHSGIIFILKKKEEPAICNNMNEARKHYAKWNKIVTERQILHGSTYMLNLK